MRREEGEREGGREGEREREREQVRASEGECVCAGGRGSDLSEPLREKTREEEGRGEET